MNGDLQELTAAELRMSEVEEMDCLLDDVDRYIIITLVNYAVWYLVTS